MKKDIKIKQYRSTWKTLTSLISDHFFHVKILQLQGNIQECVTQNHWFTNLHILRSFTVYIEKKTNRGDLWRSRAVGQRAQYNNASMNVQWPSFLHSDASACAPTCPPCRPMVVVTPVCQVERSPSSCWSSSSTSADVFPSSVNHCAALISSQSHHRPSLRMLPDLSQCYRHHSASARLSVSLQHLHQPYTH